MGFGFNPLQPEEAKGVIHGDDNEVQNTDIHQFTMSNPQRHLPTEHLSSSADDEAKNVMIGSVRRLD
jgi:hypothetical protein